MLLWLRICHRRCLLIVFNQMVYELQDEIMSVLSASSLKCKAGRWGKKHHLAVYTPFNYLLAECQLKPQEPVFSATVCFGTD